MRDTDVLVVCYLTGRAHRTTSRPAVNTHGPLQRPTRGLGAPPSPQTGSHFLQPSSPCVSLDSTACFPRILAILPSHHHADRLLGSWGKYMRGSRAFLWWACFSWLLWWGLRAVRHPLAELSFGVVALRPNVQEG